MESTLKSWRLFWMLAFVITAANAITVAGRNRVTGAWRQKMESVPPHTGRRRGHASVGQRRPCVVA